MDMDSALSFLRENQPLPPDATLSESLINAFDNVREFLTSNPNPESIPLFLGAFGDGMGHGVYQICDDVLRNYTQPQLTPHLIAALSSDSRVTRWWAAHWAMEFNAPEMLDSLVALTKNNADNDAHYFALAAIGDILADTGSATAFDTITQYRDSTAGDDLRDLCDGILNSQRSGR